MEDTTVQVANEPLLEEMLRDAEVAPEPGTIDRVIHRGDESQPAPMTLSELTSAGWCYIYETKTGERSVANKNMLPQLLKVKNTDGTSRFTTVKPQNPPFPIKVGHLKCMLHQDDSKRAHYDGMGLPLCRKSNLTSPYQVRRHMMKKHSIEWQTIEQERKDVEEKRNREMQESLIKGVSASLKRK